MEKSPLAISRYKKAPSFLNSMPGHALYPSVPSPRTRRGREDVSIRLVLPPFMGEGGLKGRNGDQHLRNSIAFLAVLAR